MAIEPTPDYPGWKRKLQPVDITANSNHAGVEVLRGFSVRVGANATQVTLRRGAVDGQVLATLALEPSTSETVVLLIPIDAPGGVYVQVVAGSITQGVLYR